MKIDYSSKAKEWCVYSHTIQKTVVFIGFCRICDILKARAAYRNKEWKRTINLGYSDVTVTIVTMHADLDEAQITANNMVDVMRPRFNTLDDVPGDQAPKIRCVTTGDEFATITEAAEALDLPPTSITRNGNMASPFLIPASATVSLNTASIAS